eukprot:7559139-Lingulodinium_polyedra.AAC.1
MVEALGRRLPGLPSGGRHPHGEGGGVAAGFSPRHLLPRHGLGCAVLPGGSVSLRMLRAFLIPRQVQRLLPCGRPGGLWWLRRGRALARALLREVLGL